MEREIEREVGEERDIEKGTIYVWSEEIEIDK